MNANLFAQFARHFPADRGRTLLVTAAGQSFSYADMDAESSRMAAVLASRGARPGDRVSIQVTKSPEALWLYLGCLRGGFVFHPLNDAYRRDEVAMLVADAEPSVAVCDPGRLAEFSSLLPASAIMTLGGDGTGTLVDATRSARRHDTSAVGRKADDLAILLYTSGTTGRAKGAMITHGNLVANAEALVSTWRFTAGDRLLHALPLYHAHGLFVGVGCTLMSGASMLFLPRFDAAEVAQHLPDCSVMMGVPTYYARLIRETALSPGECRGVRLFISGSAPLSPETFTSFRQRTGHAIVERYGMTETGMNTSNPVDGERRPGSVGMALPGVSVRIAGDDDVPLPTGVIGEIQLRGANVFPGYWRLPAETAAAFTADGYFRTGDQGSLDEHGYLTIAGRSKDLVITGGLNVHPREVEIALDALPGVAESAVIGAPHPDFGEAVVAVVVARDVGACREADIMARLGERLAGFKVPKRVFIAAELPRNSMGKVDKAALRRQYAETFTQEPATT